MEFLEGVELSLLQRERAIAAQLRQLEKQLRLESLPLRSSPVGNVGPDQQEERAAVCIQAWFRGTLDRRIYTEKLRDSLVQEDAEALRNLNKWKRDTVALLQTLTLERQLNDMRLIEKEQKKERARAAAKIALFWRWRKSLSKNGASAATKRAFDAYADLFDVSLSDDSSEDDDDRDFAD